MIFSVIKLWAAGWVLATIFQTATCQTGCRDVNSISGYSLTRHTYRMMSRVRMITCIVTCQDDPNCYSLNFKFTLQQCELNNETRISAKPKYFVPSGDTVYLDNLYRPYKPCDNSPCKNGGTCVTIDSYPGFKCECRAGFVSSNCDVCTHNNPLGMQSGLIPDKHITASSESPLYPAYKARKEGRSCWRSANNTLGEFLEIQLGQTRNVKGILIQGDPQDDNWTEQFYLSYTLGSDWKNVTDNYPQPNNLKLLCYCGPYPPNEMERENSSQNRGVRLLISRTFQLFCLILWLPRVGKR